MRVVGGCPVASQFGFHSPLSAAGLLLTIRTAAHRPTVDTEKMENMDMLSGSPTEMFCGSPTEMFSGSPT